MNDGFSQLEITEPNHTDHIFTGLHSRSRVRTDRLFSHCGGTTRPSPSRQGRRRGQQQQRGARQQFGDLGPPPQPQIDIPNLPPPPNRAVPAQQPSLPQNRFLPTGPAPGSPLPPESPVRGRIPDREGNYDFT